MQYPLSHFAEMPPGPLRRASSAPTSYCRLRAASDHCERADRAYDVIPSDRLRMSMNAPPRTLPAGDDCATLREQPKPSSLLDSSLPRHPEVARVTTSQCFRRTEPPRVCTTRARTREPDPGSLPPRAGDPRFGGMYDRLVAGYVARRGAFLRSDYRVHPPRAPRPHSVRTASRLAVLSSHGGPISASIPRASGSWRQRGRWTRAAWRSSLAPERGGGATILV